jgi:hypothetical protein
MAGRIKSFAQIIAGPVIIISTTPDPYKPSGKSIASWHATEAY